MLKVDRTGKSFSFLPKKTLREAGIWERRDFQAMIRKSPGPFCDELGELIWFVGEEVAPVDFVADRIDLLGVDPDGTAVIVELKRDSHKLQLLQALSYAGMIAKWEPRRFIENLVEFNGRGQTAEQTTEELEQMLDSGDVETINQAQRILLLAEDFDYEVLVTAEWLTERYQVDIRCYRLTLAVDNTTEFMSCSCVYPPPEITRHSIRRGRSGEIRSPKWSSWEEALTTIKNSAVIEFFRAELREGRTGYVAKRLLRFYIGNRRRYLVWAKAEHAYAWQTGRFKDDVAFWTSLLGSEANPQLVRKERALRFYLSTPEQMKKFRQAFDTTLQSVEFAAEVEADEEIEADAT